MAYGHPYGDTREHPEATALSVHPLASRPGWTPLLAEDDMLRRQDCTIVVPRRLLAKVEFSERDWAPIPDEVL